MKKIKVDYGDFLMAALGLWLIIEYGGNIVQDMKK